MRFSLEELHFIFSEINRVVKPRGFNFFSVRNQNDNSYGTDIEIEKGIYDIKVVLENMSKMNPVYLHKKFKEIDDEVKICILSSSEI